MRTELTSEQITSFRENGFVIQEDFLSTDELETWRAAVDEAVGLRGDLRIPSVPENTDEGRDNFYNQVFIQRVNLWQTHEQMKHLILDPRIGEMCCTLEGIDAIRVWHDQALIKEPWANQTSFHLDNPYWSFTSKHSISIWIALDDATQQNGCMYFIPGSHKEATGENVGIGPNMRALFGVYPQWSTRKPFIAEMKAGSCSFHNGLTAHGAGANMSNGYRRAMTCAFMPAGSTFNGRQNILSQEDLKTLKVGDSLDNDARNPLVWSKDKAAV